eukprot:EG_transcript_1513
MRLSVVFVATLAVSVIVSATATWGLTYTTSYSELQDMATGFVGLATVSVEDFAQLVWQLMADSGTLVAGILDTEYQRSMAQLNETGQEFLQTTMDLMARTRNTTAQTQGMLSTLVVSFGSFMGSVIVDFTAVGTDYTTRLRTEAASRTQSTFSNLLQDRVYAIQRQARMYEMGVLNLSRRADQPFDDGSCTLLGLLCAASIEISNNAYVGTEGGNMMLCDVTDVAYALRIYRGTTADQVQFLQWPPYLTGQDFPAWKAACIAGSNSSFMNDTCPHSNEKDYPVCNATCGYDPRCRPWYSVHYGSTVARTQMSAVYIDIQKKVPVVTLSYPIFSTSPRVFVGVAATDFFFSDVNTYLATLSAGAITQRVAVIFNSSDLLVVGSNVACANASDLSSGVGVAVVCDAVLRSLGVWLAANTALAGNASLELDGTLWDVFPGVVDSFSYFVAVGMNKTEVYATVNTVSKEANDTLQTMSRQQSARMAQLEAASLAEMDAVAQARIASLQALEAGEQLHMKELQNQTAVALNASRQKSAVSLSNLTSTEMTAINALEDFHLTKVKKSVGTTFGAVVGIFAGILLLGAYGTWAVTKQVQNIAQVMEDVANMCVEEIQVFQKSPIREVQRIEVALGILVSRLAEYKSYMPAALFQQQQQQQRCNELPEPESCLSPTSAPPGLQSLPSKKRVSPSPRGAHISPLRRESAASSTLSGSHASVRSMPVVNCARLLRRSAVVMAVNIVRFQRDMAQVAAAQLEGALNRLISTVHRLAAKAQGNIDAIIGDQLLVTFNAHFACSDPPTAAANVALDVVTTLKEDPLLLGRVQIGLAAGPVFVGHLGYASFKAMVALGAPMKVAALLSHLSAFHESVVLLCPSVEERIKYHFTVQPADLISLPVLGEHVAVYAKSLTVFCLEGRVSVGPQAQEWLYQVSDKECASHWAALFREVARTHSLQKALEDVEGYLRQNPGDRLAQRLLGRLPYWLPRMGVVLAERPDVARDAPLDDSQPPTDLHTTLSLRSLK